jgi:RHS repeat-associated protein/uncharacterized repeat protein (TIGR01451 family)
MRRLGRFSSRALAIASLVVLVAGLMPAQIARAENGNANLHLDKTVGSVAVSPQLALTLAVDKPDAVPGTVLAYTGVVTNTGATLTLAGDLVATNTNATAATIASYWDAISTNNKAHCGAGGTNDGKDTSQWPAFVGTAAAAAGYTPVSAAPIASGMTLVATPVSASGVTYPAGTAPDQILGTLLAPGAIATWHYTASIPLTAAQLAFLRDPAQVSRIRNSFHAEPTPRVQAGNGQPDQVNVDFCGAFNAADTSGAASNVTVTVTLPDGTTKTIDKSTVPSLASIAPGASATVTATYTVPVPAAKGATETDAAYLARLATLDGKTLTASATATVGTSGPTAGPAGPVSTTEHLPILSVAKTGPATVDAGNSATYSLALANTGSAPAASLTITDTLPGGTVIPTTGTPASLAPGGKATAAATYPIPAAQPAGNLTDTASLAWKDANGNAYGPLSDSFTTKVQNTLRGAHLALSPATAGPLVVGSEHTLKATLTDRNGAVVPGQVVHFVVTGANPTSGNANTDASGVATFTYVGHAAGTDQAQATATKNATTVQSNTASASWIAPIQPVSITTVHGNFYTNTGVAYFTATPASTPVFGQDFPTIDFNPPAGTVLNNISAVDTSTRPFTDLTTDINGNFTGSIVAEGNGHQAGVADLTHFDAVFTGSFVATQASDVTFNVFSDAGFILGVGGGATRVNGAFENPPASGTTPFQAYPVVGAYNIDSAPAAHPVTIHFPAPGSYPFEIDYFECCDSALSLTLTTVSFIGDQSPLSIYVGYADGLRPGGSVFPFPWKGAPGVTFIGDNGTYDAGAVRFDNSSDSPIVLDSAIVEIAGVLFDIWGRNLTVPAHGTLIATQTTQFNFDTSDVRVTCTPAGTIPHVKVSIGGVVTTYNDTNQVLNTGDIDLAACPGGPNESHAWERIGGGGTPVNHALPPAAALTIDPNTASATVGLGQSFTITAMDASGQPVADLPINVQVFGVNTRTLTATTDVAGIATVSYIGASSGKDQVQARAFVTGMLAISDISTITWANPATPGGGGDPSPFPPPSIGSIVPADGATVTAPVAIKAAITPPTGETITDWKVTYQRDGTSGTPIVLASGTGTPPSTLATFDPTVLANGGYTITITAFASGGGGLTSSVNVIVEGNLKLGRYSVTYQDANVPVGGIPIQVLRTYDSFDKSQGDFGIGWQIGVSNFRVSANGVLGAGGWSQYDSSCVIGICQMAWATARPHFVTVVWPDGHTEIFDFTPTGGSNLFWIGTADFTTRAGSTSKLAVDGDASLSYRGDGNLYGGLGGPVFNPTRFRLTAKDGTVYVLDTTSGLVSETDRVGNTVTVDAAGIHSSLGPSVTFTRDTSGRITKLTKPDGTSVGYVYNAAGDLVSVTDERGDTVTYQYDSAHNLLSTKDPAGHPLRTLTYGTDGRLKTITDGAGNTSTISLDPNAHTETVTGPDPRLTTVTSLNERGDIVQIDELFGGKTLTTKFTYDALGHVLGKTDPLGHATKATYDAAGSPLTLTEADGGTWHFAYNDHEQLTSITDRTGRVVATLEYDSYGELVKKTTADGGATTYAYDNRGLLTSMTDPLHRTTAYGYDAAGHVTTVTGPDSRAWSYAYDADGRTKSVTDPASETTSFVYDAAGNLTSFTDAAGHGQSYGYDTLGRLSSGTDGLGHATTYSYDLASRLTGVLDRNGATTTFEYDTAGHVTKVNLPGGSSLTYSYDPLGQLVEADDADATLAFTYDNSGNLASQTSAGTPTSSQPSVALSFGRDAAGRPTSLAAPWGTSSFAYDANGLLSKVTDPTAGVFNLGYDPLGRLASLTRPNGVTDSYTYDAAGQFSSRSSSKSSSVIDALSYTYDSSGRRTSKTDAAGTTTYGCDTADRLISVLAPTGSSLPNETFAYDAAGNQTGAGQTYDAANRLLSDAKFDYSYDAEGNQTAKTERASGKVTTYTWNALHQLTSAHLPDGSTVTYRYDALGRRVEQSGSAGTTRYVNLGANVVAEYDGSNALRASYVTTIGAGSLPGMPLAVSVGAANSYPLLDGVGSVVGTTDASGTVTPFAYTAYGTPVGASSRTYAYGTYGYDSATGLYYARARYYDSGSGRFLSEDPVPATNRFAYAAGNPQSRIDPSGMLLAEEGPPTEEDLVLFRVVGEGELKNLLFDRAFSMGETGYQTMKLFWTSLKDAQWYEAWLSRIAPEQVAGIVRAVLPRQLAGALWVGADAGHTMVGLPPEVLGMVTAIDVLLFIPMVP